MNYRRPLTHIFLLGAFFFSTGCRSSNEPEDADDTLVSVEIAKVVRTTLHAFVTAYGTVTPAPAEAGKPGGAAHLSSPISGVVQAVLVSEGETVHAGDLIVSLDDRMAQADVDRAKAAVLIAEQSMEREKILLAQQNTSQRRFEEVQQAQSLAQADLMSAEGVLAQVQLRSPIDGVVSVVRVLPGQSVDLNTTVAEIVNTSQLIVTSHVPAADAALVVPGQSAEIAITTGTNDTVSARVSSVSPSVNPETGTVLVRLVPSTTHDLSSGQFVSIRVVVAERAERLAVPRESVFIGDDGMGILAVVRNDSARQMLVNVGLQEGALIEVDGPELQEGMTVATTGSYALPEITRVLVIGDGENER